MKIDELPRCDGYGIPGGAYIRASDLPPRRDAKTDPPKIYAWVACYTAVGKYQGIGKLSQDGQWRGPDGWHLDVASWSEILHW